VSKEQAYFQNERFIAYGEEHRLTAMLPLATACIASLTAVRSSLQADCKTSGFAVLRWSSVTHYTFCESGVPLQGAGSALFLLRRQGRFYRMTVFGCAAARRKKRTIPLEITQTFAVLPETVSWQSVLLDRYAVLPSFICSLLFGRSWHTSLDGIPFQTVIRFSRFYRTSSFRLWIIWDNIAALCGNRGAMLKNKKPLHTYQNKQGNFLAQFDMYVTAI